MVQDPILFNRSVRENITYGAPLASEDSIGDAATSAGAADFISELGQGNFERGLQVTVGERGSALSGGQRQRIMIARVLLRKPPILLMDEATSGLDAEGEALVIAEIARLCPSSTVISSAHRLAALAKSDFLVVMDGGRVAEIGSPTDLQHSGGLYERLWTLQAAVG